LAASVDQIALMEIEVEAVGGLKRDVNRLSQQVTTLNNDLETEKRLHQEGIYFIFIAGLYGVSLEWIALVSKDALASIAAETIKTEYQTQLLELESKSQAKDAEISRLQQTITVSRNTMEINSPNLSFCYYQELQNRITALDDELDKKPTSPILTKVNSPHMAPPSIDTHNIAIDPMHGMVATELETATRRHYSISSTPAMGGPPHSSSMQGLSSFKEKEYQLQIQQLSTLLTDNENEIERLHQQEKVSIDNMQVRGYLDTHNHHHVVDTQG
jgi:hypothetical protein